MTKPKPARAPKRGARKAPAPPIAAPEPVATVFARALALHKAGKAAEARDLYRVTLQADPAHADAHHLLGVAEAQSGNHGVAAQAIAAALALQPGNTMFLFNYGNVLRDLKRPAEAVAAYDAAVAANPGFADAWCNRASALRTLGRSADALASVDRAIALRPQLVEALACRAHILLELKRYAEAVTAYDAALALRPAETLLWCNRGVALRELKRPGDALASYDRALQVDPHCVEALHNRANVLGDMDRFADALASYDQVLALQPAYVQTLSNRGTALRRLHRIGEALDSFDRAIALDPDLAQAHCNRGITLHEVGRTDEALAAFDRALAIRPKYVEAWSNRGTVLKDLRRFDEALAAYDEGHRLNASIPELEFNRANTLRTVGRFAEAIAGYDRAIALKPDYAEALSARGLARMDVRQLDGALADCRRAIALRPDLAEAHWNLSLCLLMGGDYPAGWEEYEWRYRVPDAAPFRRTFPQPMWLGGDSIAGKTILLHAEQGYGDTIQFCRYVELVAALGARVILEVQPALASLLAQVAGAHQVIARGAALPAFDCHCPLLSLPHALRTTLASIPARVPYLTAAPERVAAWRKRLAGRPGPRIGLVWSGSPTHGNDAHRSAALQALAPLLDTGATFISLHKELRDTDARFLVEHPKVLHFGPELGDFSDTAALAGALDLVISVDTSVAHLAGALGKPVWILLPFAASDWRWLLDRSDTPWYPTARLFRQPSLSDWNGVVSQVRTALLAHIAAR